MEDTHGLQYGFSDCGNGNIAADPVNFMGQKRADDLNNQIFLFFAVLGILDVAAELLSNYYISLGGGDFGLAAMLTTTVFYLFQALLPFTLICYIVTLHDNKMISAKKCCCPAWLRFF